MKQNEESLPAYDDAGRDLMKRCIDLPRCGAEVVFRPALTPLEAAVLPALERPSYGALRMVRRAGDAGEERAECGGAQRAKIWVR